MPLRGVRGGRWSNHGRRISLSKRFLILVGLLVVSILAACGESSPSPQTPQPHGTAAPTAAPPPTVPSEGQPTAYPPATPPATSPPTRSPGPPSPEEARTIIEQRAAEVIAAIRDRDFAALSSYVQPDTGLRFSPYSFVSTENDVVLTVEQIQGALTDPTVYHWGLYDGSGMPIDLTFAEYYGEFVYSQDFAQAPEIGYNEILGTGNTINNVFEVYEDAIVVEYHFPGFDPQYGGMDWESLRLVFQEEAGVWYLVAVVHDQWTI